MLLGNFDNYVKNYVFFFWGVKFDLVLVYDIDLVLLDNVIYEMVFRLGFVWIGEDIVVDDFDVFCKVFGYWVLILFFIRWSKEFVLVCVEFVNDLFCLSGKRLGDVV